MAVTPKPIALSEADVARFWSKVDKCGPDECWEWTEYRDECGYGRFYDCVHSIYQAHRVAYIIANGDTELEVCHTCNHPWCCNPNHLYAGTQRINILQCHAEGRAADRCGENNGRVKLTESDVQEIRRLYAGGWFQREIAGDYGIHQTHVSAICRGHRWKHI